MDIRSKSIRERLKGISLRVVILLLVFTLFVWILYQLTDEIVLDNQTGFDEKVYAWLKALQSPATTRWMLFFTFFGSIQFLLPAYLVLSLYFLLYRKNTSRSVNIAAVGISSGLLLHLVKSIFQRHRPPHPLIAAVTGFSYPSGHSFSSFTLAGLLIYMLWEGGWATTWKITGSVLLFIAAAMVALSRVYLHVHYGSDVLAGFCLSFIWLTICIYLLKKIRYS